MIKRIGCSYQAANPF